jgi:hypothetical protein
MTEMLHTVGKHIGQSMFRETLVRELGGTRTLCVCGQNPSYAEADDEDRNDMTILRLMGFATRLGFGRLVMVNTYHYRASTQVELYRWLNGLGINARTEARARATEIVIREAIAADQFIAAWGNGSGFVDPHPKQLLLDLVAAGVDVHAFGFTQSGYPLHPMARGRHRIPDDAVPQLWLRGRQ